MTDQEFKNQQERFLEDAVSEIRTELFRKLDSALKSGAIPENWKEDGSHLLTKAIVNSFCKDQPFRIAT